MFSNSTYDPVVAFPGLILLLWIVFVELTARTVFKRHHLVASRLYALCFCACIAFMVTVYIRIPDKVNAFIVITAFAFTALTQAWSYNARRLQAKAFRP